MQRLLRFGVKGFLLPRRSISMTASVDTFRKRKKILNYDIDERITVEQYVDNILYNSPPTERNLTTRHIVNCLVSNEPGVLSRITGVLAARGFNIDSLVVCQTDSPLLSRTTIVLNGLSSVVEQVKKQLEDLVPVWAVLDYTHGNIIERELLLVKVWTVPNDMVDKYNHHNENISPLVASSLQRQTISEITNLDSLLIELSATPERIDAFLKLLRPYGIIEATRSGVMAMPRDPIEFDKVKEDEDESNDIDPTLLPPG